MNENIIISVIVPIYNGEKMLARCIKSILQQTFNKFELILVDDGSTDGTLPLCRHYELEDERVKVVSQDNGGELAARASGVRRSQGDWLYFVDVDDMILPDTLSSMFECIRDEDTDVIVFESANNGTYTHIDYAIALLNFKYWTVWGKLYRRYLYDEYVMKIPRYFKVGGDFLTNLKISRNIRGKVLCSPQKKYVYTQNSESSIQSQHKSDYAYEREMVIAVDKIINSFPKNRPLKRALFDWKMIWLGGMIGLRYKINKHDDWIVGLLSESSCYHLSLKERIIVASVNHSIPRLFLIFEKVTKLTARKIFKI